MPKFQQEVMLAAPTTHFTELSQAILYRGAGLEVVWKHFAVLLIIGTVLFLFSLARFRKTIGQMAEILTDAAQRQALKKLKSQRISSGAAILNRD